MSTEQIIWTVVIVVAVLALIGLAVAFMRKRSARDDRNRAEELRDHADRRAAVIPEADARAREVEAQAEQSRLRAERDAERAREARDELRQQEALVEDRVRAADRLDPEVDHKSDDYSPEVPTPDREDTDTGVQPTEPTDTTPRDEATGVDDKVLRHRLGDDSPGDTGDNPAGDTGGTHRA